MGRQRLTEDEWISTQLGSAELLTLNPGLCDCRGWSWHHLAEDTSKLSWTLLDKEVQPTASTPISKSHIAAQPDLGMFWAAKGGGGLDTEGAAQSVSRVPTRVRRMWTDWVQRALDQGAECREITWYCVWVSLPFVSIFLWFNPLAHPQEMDDARMLPGGQLEKMCDCPSRPCRKGAKTQKGRFVRVRTLEPRPASLFCRRAQGILHLSAQERSGGGKLRGLASVDQGWW